MNCQRCQQSIVDSLAVGASHVSPEVMAHQQSCPACAQFFATEGNLFRAIDAGLRSVVNQPLPPSLLPTVRARLGENAVPQRTWLLGWNLAAVVALAILAFAVSHALLRRHSAVNSEPITSTSRQLSTPPQVPRDNATIQAQPEAVRVLPVSNRERNAHALATEAPEVIVSAEEREAFAKFVAEVPEQPTQVALALTHPASGAFDAPSGTALLRIDLVEVNSLDGTENE